MGWVLHVIRHTSQRRTKHRSQQTRVAQGLPPTKSTNQQLISMGTCMPREVSHTPRVPQKGPQKVRGVKVRNNYKKRQWGVDNRSWSRSGTQIAGVPNLPYQPTQPPLSTCAHSFCLLDFPCNLGYSSPYLQQIRLIAALPSSSASCRAKGEVVGLPLQQPECSLRLTTPRRAW